jgi:hypothetical protein
VKVNRRKIQNDSDTDFRADSDSDDHAVQEVEPASHYEVQQEVITLAVDKREAELRGSQGHPNQHPVLEPTAAPIRQQHPPLSSTVSPVKQRKGICSSTTKMKSKA